MRCLGRTNKLKRCKNDAKFMFFCSAHKWQPLVFLFTLLTIIGDYSGLYRELIKPQINRHDQYEKEQVLSGIIWNENNNPLSGVVAYLVDFNMTDTTDLYGKFEFKVINAPKYELVQIICMKDGFITEDRKVMIGNPSLNFILGENND